VGGGEEGVTGVGACWQRDDDEGFCEGGHDSQRLQSLI
jgi:hypothetical protein